VTQTAFRLSLAVMGISVLVTGCASAPNWTHPSKPETATATDLRRCERQAERVALDSRGQSRGDLAGQTHDAADPMALKDRQSMRRLFDAQRDACMIGLGYRRTES